MNYGKAVEEVWSWRDSLNKELEKIPEANRNEYLNSKAEAVCQKYGMKCHVTKREQAHY
jgi:vacuolar-type H+-ATPase subunit E/Vma4